METLIISLLILNTFIGVFLIVKYNILYNKFENIYYEVSYVGKVLDLILQYAENKYNK